jgi:hypothetical protein
MVANFATSMPEEKRINPVFEPGPLKNHQVCRLCVNHSEYLLSMLTGDFPLRKGDGINAATLIPGKQENTNKSLK